MSMNDKINISFAGCGFLGLYHLGVTSCLKTYAPQLKANRVSGASAGALAAVSFLADLPLGEMTSNILRVATEARALTLGPFSPSFKVNEIVKKGLEELLPNDVHTKVNGKLHVSLTKVYDGQNMLVNQFSSKQEVIEVVLASCFIPVFTGWVPPRYRGTRVIDGGYSDNLPILDGHTVTVSPFCGSSDICPQDETMFSSLQVSIANCSIELSKENLMRLGRVLLPPDAEVLSTYCKQGFDDTLRFLQKRYMISCTRCLAVASTYEIEDEMDEEEWEVQSGGCKEYDPNCLECKLQRHIASQSTVPENIWEVFEKTMAESETMGWVHSLNSYRIVRILTYPARLQISVAYGLISRLTSLLPSLTEETKMRVEKLIGQLYQYISSGGYLMKEPSHLAKYTCEFNITQYGEDSMTDLTQYSEKERRESVKDILNLGFTAHLESKVSPELPLTQEEALRFQEENLAAAVVGVSQSKRSSRVQSRVGSLAPSRLASMAASRAQSRVGSRMGSRTNSMSSLHNVDGELPETLGSIKSVTDSQEAVMSFYYTDAANQVKVMEIFDVTQTDPSLLVSDSMGIQYSMDDQVLPNDCISRLRHSSGPSTVASKSRRNSVQSLGFPSPPGRARHPSAPTTTNRGFERSLSGAHLSGGRGGRNARFLVGDQDDSDEEEEEGEGSPKKGYFSDPESEESEDKSKMVKEVATGIVLGGRK